MPLKLAYALTIHKCQGMTLDAVEVDLGKVFAAGQGYTAISRAKSLKSIKVKSVSKNSFLIKESVLEFYKNIENTVLEKSEIFINKLINTMIFRIVNHTDLENCLNFVY
jgi:ATP-dependent DNA helicase PIF1